VIEKNNIKMYKKPIRSVYEEIKYANSQMKNFENAAKK
jgi:hypothetical protein